MAIANEYGLPLFHFNVKQAFVRAKFDHAIFVCFEGGCGGLSGRVVKLYHALDGLKQIRHQWNAHLVDELVEFGIEKLKAESCDFP